MQSVMIIEDDADIARLLARHLDHHGRRSRVLSSGEEALSILGNQEAALPDAVICDLGLPGISGIEVVEAIRAAERTARLPVVLMSARCTMQDHAMALSAGADEFFDKPLKLKALDEALTRLLAT
jgi:two-component system phosphate regulon response regulator PhoB